MRRYLRIIDQPVEVDSGTVSRVAREPFGLEGEALLGAFDHGLDRANFGLADGARCLDVHDDAELHVNQIIVGISKERRPAHGPRPLGSGVGRGDELGCNVAGCPKMPRHQAWRDTLWSHDLPPLHQALCSTVARALIAAYWRPQQSD